MKVLQNAVLLACRAPSVHNSQPWRWVAENNRLHLFVDRRHLVPATDHSGRQAILSCGAALDHLCVAMLAAQWQTNVARFPNPNNPDHLASIEFSHVDHVTPAQRSRALAILQRRTDRLPFDEPVPWHLFESVLRSQVNPDIAILDVLSDEQRPQLVQASQLSAALRRDDASYHAELDWWTAPFAMAEGVPPAALASDTERRRVGVGRDFPVRIHQNRRPEVKADCAKVVVLSTPGDTRADVLRCGEVLSTVLLECTMARVATCPLTHLIESPESRDVIRDLIGGRGEPQVLIRIGTAPAMEELPIPTPRRALHTVLEIR